jgi:DNA segregation ATPase FtsK/SpoIIIE, S-DNA-T family
LDFDDEQSGVDGVETAGWDEEDIAVFNWESVEALFELGGLQSGFKLRTRYAAFQTGNQMGVGCGFEDVPHFGFGFAFQTGRDGGRWVDLERETVAGVEELDEKGKTGQVAGIGAEELRAEGFDQLMQCFAGQGAVEDDALGIGAVADFPAFADVLAGGDVFAVAGEGVAAPDSLKEDRLKTIGIEHDCALQLIFVSTKLHFHKEELQTIFMGKKNPEHGHAREIWAVVLVAAAALLFLSLISYDPFDVGNSATTGGHAIHNFIGAFGAWLAYAMFQSLGLGAYFLMVVLAVIGTTLLMGKELPWRGKVLAGLLLMVSSCCLLHVAPLQHLVKSLNLPESAGGFVGLFLGGLSQRIVDKPGTVIIWGSAYIISLILLINFSPTRWVLFTAAGIQDFWAKLRGEGKKASVNEELGEKERELRFKEVELKRELARKEKEAKKIESEPRMAVPEPKYFDATAAKPSKAEAKKEESLVKKLSETLSPKKEKPEPVPVSEPDVALPAVPEPVATVAAAPVLKPKREKKSEPAEPGLIAGASADIGEQFVLPSMDLLEQPPAFEQRSIVDDLKGRAQILRDTVREFGIEVESGDVTKGPTVTLFELHPAPGVRVEKITALSSNIAMAMRAEKVRILAPVPGKGTVGVEVPNHDRTTVYLRDMLESEEWQKTNKAIPVALGRDVKGHAIFGDIANMPHMLVAGATGSGKTVCINAILASLLYRFTAEDLRLVLVDPKMVEMQHYNALPHLIVPVVTEAKKVPLALGWVIREMEKRFQIFAKVGVRNISGFNSRQKQTPKPAAQAEAEKNDKPQQEELKIEVPRDSELIIPEKLPFIVVVVDELADLMATVGKDVEMAIARLTALGRAAGIHLIVATQRPSVNVVTGVIKANIPSRIAFQVASMQDSRVILDSPGAEKLLGKGDMLYEPGSGKTVRAQGVLVMDKEINRIVDFIAAKAKPKFEAELEKKLKKNVNLPDEEASDEDEELVEQCIEVIRQTNRASVSILQRRLRIGYTRAARIMDLLEERGVVGPGRGAEPRDILIDLDEQVGQDPAGEES